MQAMSWKRFWAIMAVCLALMVLAIFFMLDGGDINDPEFMCRFGMGRRSWVCD
ncbi:hypothetical protein ACWGQ2_08500 [Arthrobacter sp. NPDC055585]